MHFHGFPEGKVRLTPIPAPFFSELLPEIDHLGELKVTLYAFWRLDRMEGAFRYLRQADFAGDERFMQGLGATPAEAEALWTMPWSGPCSAVRLLQAALDSGERASRRFIS